jgi:hypothetical protein
VRTDGWVPPNAVVSDFEPSNRLEAYFHTCDELLHMWAHAEDLDTLEFALMQVITYIAGPDVSTELADEIIAHYETAYPPFKRNRLAQIGNVLMNVSYGSK